MANETSPNQSKEVTPIGPFTLRDPSLPRVRPNGGAVQVEQGSIAAYRGKPVGFWRPGGGR